MTLRGVISAARFWSNLNSATWDYIGNGVTPGDIPMADLKIRKVCSASILVGLMHFSLTACRDGVRDSPMQKSKAADNNSIEGNPKVNRPCRKTDNPGRKLTESEIIKALSGSRIAPNRCLKEGFTPFSEIFKDNGIWSIGREQAVYTVRNGKWKTDGDSLVVQILSDEDSEDKDLISRYVFVDNEQFYIEDISYQYSMEQIKGEKPVRYIPIEITPYDAEDLK